jgi:Leucine-rich repeat (LRR) protein
MKKLTLSLFLLILIRISFCQIIDIPDTNFINALIEQGIDSNTDSLISIAEAEAITYLNVHNRNISSLTGIEAFINLDTLICSLNQLTSLDISNNTALIYLSCRYNKLPSLDVSNNTALTFLNCSWNLLPSLNVSNNTALLRLDCLNNQLTSLNISTNLALTYLECSYNELTSLDVSNNTALLSLYCGSNQLTKLDVSNNELLNRLLCSYNQLTNLNVTNNPNIIGGLDCMGNQLTSLDISNNTAMTSLQCSENQLTSLDVSNHADLEILYCGDNLITNLDISNSPNLYSLVLSNMPSLFKVCVWKMPFPPAGVEVDTTDSPNVYFTSDCNAPPLNTDSTFSAISCDEYISPSGKIWNISDVYMDTIPNASGFDSIITINLTILETTYASIFISSCGSYISPSGQVWNVTNTYTDTIPNAAGCDSVITIDLTIDCTNLINNNSILNVMIYPNPTNDFVTVEFNELKGMISTEVYDLTCQLISTKTYYNKRQLTLFSTYPKGIYFIRLSDNEGKMSVFKIIKY